MEECCKVETNFKGYDRQVFPQGLDGLNNVYAEFAILYYNSSRKDFLQNVRRSRRLDIDIVDAPETEDHYRWQAGLTLGSGEVAVLFPDSNGSFNDHTVLRRSVGVYVRQGVADGVVDFFVEELCLGILGVKKSEPYRSRRA